MKDAFAHKQINCHGDMSRLIVSMVCFLCAATTTAFSQTGVTAPVPPTLSAPGYTIPSQYGNAVYGYAPAPMTGPYYSGNSPMLQPQVQSQLMQPTPMQMQALQAMQANQAGHAGGMMSPYPMPGYESPYGNMYGGGYMQQMYEQMYDRQHDGHFSDYEAANQVVGQPKAGSSSNYNPYTPLRSPLLETGWEQAKLLSPFNAPDGPHRGVGKPLEDESWLDRPYYFGVFGGWVSGDKLISGQIDQKSGSNGGVTLGWNLNHYWGVEGRIFGSSIDIKDISDSATQAPGRSSRLTVLDASAHYYPYGEAKWRPYFKLGIGYAEERFTDNSGNKHKLNTWTVPLGMGLKYWWSDRVNVYGEIVDNVVFGKGPTKTHGNVALNFGVNFTFGTNPNYHPTVYWPQTPSQPY